MAEPGGTTTQSGILFQNAIGALYLGRMVDPRARPLDETPVEVRVEAPEHVDDIVVRFADGHRRFVQAKERIDTSGDAWKKLWHDFEQQLQTGLGDDDRLVLWLGQSSPDFDELREICERTAGYNAYTEWYERLPKGKRYAADDVRSLLAHQDGDTLFTLLKHVAIEMTTLEQIERDYVPTWMPESQDPMRLFRVLRDICGDQARYREPIAAEGLRDRLSKEGYTIRAGPLVPVPFQVPPLSTLSSRFTPRPGVHDDLKRLLVAQQPDPGLRLVAIHGMPGSGKSVMAADVASDQAVRQHFADGILWATLGQEPANAADILRGWIQALGGEFSFTDPAVGLRRLGDLLQRKAMLIVIDDAWNGNDVNALATGGPACVVLITTREALVADVAHVKPENMYLLGVMQEDESLALLAGGQGHTLTHTDSAVALQVASALGFLPLALDLAAALVSDPEAHLSWQDVLDDVGREIDRLESLEKPLVSELPLADRPKGLSLRASLNLSIARLSAERREQFAWLGILAEDSPITAQAAATLWSLDVRAAQTGLAVLRGKALLKPPLLLPDRTPAYVMHDLVRVAARRLLGAPHVPREPGEQPGFELSMEQAHGLLLDRYHGQTRDGDWASLADDGYICDHLAWHMAKAGRVADLYTLISKPWMARRLALAGSPYAFAGDADQAIQSAKAETPPNILQIIRCSLIYANLCSLATNVPPGVLAVLARVGQVDRAMGYAALTHGASKKTEAYREIAQALVAAGTPAAAEAAARAWQAALLIQSDHQAEKSVALSKAAIALAEAGNRDAARQALEQARQAAQILEEEKEKAEGLTAVAHALAVIGDKDAARSVCRESLQAAQTITYDPDRATALSTLAPILAVAGDADGAQMAATDALQSAQRIEDGQERAETLAAIAQALATDGDKGAAFTAGALAEQAARTIEDTPERVEALLGIARAYAAAGDLGTARQTVTQALLAAQEIGIEREKAQALTAVTKALAAFGDLDLARKTGAEVLQTVKEIGDVQARLLAFARASGALAAAGDIQAAMQAAQESQSSALQSQALADIAQSLAAAGDVRAALQAAEQITNDQQKAQALTTVGQALVAAGDAPLARRAVEAALHSAEAARAAQLPSESTGRKAQTLVAVAHVLAAGGELDAACLAARAALEGGRPIRLQIRVPWLAAEALCTLAGVFVAAGDMARARTAAQQATAALERFGERTPRAPELNCSLSHVFSALGDWDGARAAVQRARESALAAETGPKKARGLSTITRDLTSAGDMDTASDVASQTLQIASKIASKESKVEALSAAVEALLVTGQGQAAHKAAERARLAAAGIVAAKERVGALSVVARSFASLGDMDSARQVALQAWDEAKTATDGKQHAAAPDAVDEDDSDIDDPDQERSAMLSNVAQALAAATEMHEAQSAALLAYDAALNVRYASSRAAALTGAVRSLAAAGATSEALRAADDAFRSASQLVGARMDKDRKERAIRDLVRILSSSALEPAAMRILIAAFDDARHSRPDAVFYLLAAGSDMLGAVDRGRTLRQVYEAVMAVESWWSNLG